MKKFLITLFLILILIGFYLTGALNINLSSGNKLDISSWQNINNITSKINLDNNNLNISGKLVASGKICLSNGECLGICREGYIFNGGSCELVPEPECKRESSPQTWVDFMGSNTGGPSGAVMWGGEAIGSGIILPYEHEGYIYSVGEFHGSWCVMGSSCPDSERLYTYNLCRVPK